MLNVFVTNKTDFVTNQAQLFFLDFKRTRLQFSGKFATLDKITCRQNIGTLSENVI